MPIELKMPALSPTMEEGTLAKWLVKEGDEVKSGDILAEIETDKATMEIEAIDEGRIARILVPEGTDGVKVGAPIAIMAAEGEDAGEVPCSRCGGGKAQAAGQGEGSAPKADQPVGTAPAQAPVETSPAPATAAETPALPLLVAVLPSPAGGEGRSGKASPLARGWRRRKTSTCRSLRVAAPRTHRSS